MKQSIAMSRDRVVMDSAKQLYAGHGDQVVAEQGPAVTDSETLRTAFEKSSGNALLTVPEFLAQATRRLERARVPAGTPGAGGEDEEEEGVADSGSDDGESIVSGPMADAWTAAPSAPSSRASSVGGKRLPQVPPFATPPAKRAKSAAPSEWSLASSAGASVAARSDAEYDDSEECEALMKLPREPGCLCAGPFPSFQKHRCGVFWQTSGPRFNSDV